MAATQSPPITIALRDASIVLLLCIASTSVASAQTFTLLSTFDYSNGGAPYAELVQGFNSKYYGTTAVGGANQYGTIFEITPRGNLTTLYNFCSRTNCIDGNFPISGLVQTTNGSFYGTTEFGGANGKGIVFELTSRGKLVTLYSFCSQANCTDGGYSSSGVVQASDGNFYGTTYGGGIYNYGTVFEITSQGKLTTLYSFCALTNCADGAYLSAGLVQAPNGNFYGTTTGGGSTQCVAGCGTIFEITPKGKLTTLYSFCSKTGCADGIYPEAPLVQATNGTFLGTTSQGGGADDAGTIFSVTPKGKLTTLYSFCSQTNCADGESPQSGLMQATNGDFYGVASQGGGSNYGTVFSESLKLGPFVTTTPTSGKPGAEVIILGDKLKGTLRVSFHDTPAKFTVISATEIKTSVPVGATTGYLTVTGPKRNLKSNFPFRVMR